MDHEKYSYDASNDFVISVRSGSHSPGTGEQRFFAHEEKTTITWNNFESMDQDVEKLIYPMKMDDDYDQEVIGDVASQVNVF